jgi:hypothetical protein
MNDATESVAQEVTATPPATSAQRPAFAKDFPHSAAIETLLDAFEKGNYAYVKTAAEKLRTTSEDPEEKSAAQELLQRLRPDPLAIKLLLAAVGLLAVLTIWTYATHHH